MIADETLMQELAKIESEVTLRKRRGEPWAAWAYEQRMAVVMASHERIEAAQPAGEKP